MLAVADQFNEQPRWAQVALLARCARHAHLLLGDERVSAADHDAIVGAISFAEEAAANAGAVPSSRVEAAIEAERTVSRLAGVVPPRSRLGVVAATAGAACSAAIRGARVGGRTPVSCADPAAALIACATSDSQIACAIRSDLAALGNAGRAGSWTDSTAVPESFFGEFAPADVLPAAPAPKRLNPVKPLRRRFVKSLTVLYIAFPVLIMFLHRDRTPAGSQKQVATAPAGPPLGELAVEGPGGSERWARWDRKEAVKFSLDKLDTQITLFLGGAAALVAAIAKMAADSIWGEPGKRQPMTRGDIKVAAAVCAFGGWSLFFGVQAESLFARLGDAPRFSIYTDLGAFAALQIVFFFVALTIVVGTVLRRAWAGTT